MLLMFLVLLVFVYDDVKIVVSFFIFGDMVEQVVGEYVSVIIIVGLDVDVYVYQLLVVDLKVVVELDVIFVNGFGFEIWFDILIKEFGIEVMVYVVIEGVFLVKVDGEIDLYVWNVLFNGVIYVCNIVDVMGKVMLDYVDDFNVNVDVYIVKFEVLDMEI